ncbi:hypothetical protein DRP04_00850 [Archaeoglobales archaeon]|nr:MAG: hypothetical protein DRP04_00850 [Archaeoglobales archaeon]
MGIRKVEKAIVFEKIVDPVLDYAGEDSAKIIKELGLLSSNDFILRAWWRWRPGSPPRRYDELAKKITEIRSFSKVIISGGIHAITIWRRDYDDYLYKWINYPETWQMAFDPTKFGIPISKEMYNCQYIKKQGFSYPLPCTAFHPCLASNYAPDLTNSAYQTFLYHMGLRQVESGCNAVWIDAWLWVASDMVRVTGDPKHPAVKAIVTGFNAVGDMLRKSGALVSTWYSKVPFRQKIDIVTINAATPQEILNFKISEERIENEIREVRRVVGNVPIAAFIDWGGASPSMYAFSQQLSPEKQSKFLIYATEFYKSYPEITFVYPVMGGTMGRIGQGPTIKSFGKFDVYCSFAPEFRTYDTIKKLLTKERVIKPVIREKVVRPATKVKPCEEELKALREQIKAANREVAIARQKYMQTKSREDYIQLLRASRKAHRLWERYQVLRRRCQ